MATLLLYLLAAIALFSLGALVAAKMIGGRSWRDTIKWMLEFFS